METQNTVKLDSIDAYNKLYGLPTLHPLVTVIDLKKATKQIDRLRLDYAARQLRTTDQRITAIWQDAGFESQKTFNRNFLACYHMTPSRYRKTQAPIGEVFPQS